MPPNNDKVASGNQVTTTRWNNTVDDANNTDDDIHGQYSEPRLDMSTGIANHIRAAGVGTFWIGWRPPIVGIKAYNTYDDDELQYYQTALGGAGDTQTQSMMNVAFLRGIYDQVNIEGLMLVARTGGAETASAVSKVLKVNNAGVGTLIDTGAVKAVAYDAAFHRVQFDSGSAIDITGAAADDIIQVYIDMTTNVVVNGDNISALIKNLKVTPIAT